MKQKKTIIAFTDVFKMDDGNTTAIWVGVTIGTVEPVSIEALFRDDTKATRFQNLVASYEDIDEMVDVIVRRATREGAELVRVSTDDDAIILKR